MLFSKICLVLAFINTALAAFFWYPEYRCIEDDECVLPVSSGTPSARGLSSDVQDQAPKRDEAYEQKINRVIERMVRKYERKSVSQGTPSLERRATNTYPIVTATAPTQSLSAGIDQDGTDYSYFSTLLFGSNGTPLHMLLDTGASNTWVMGTGCQSSACQIHNSFGTANSGTLQETTDTFSIAYGVGSVSGVIGSDTVSFAGITNTMSFGIASVTSDDFLNFPVDGILGLSLTKSDPPSFIQTLVASKALTSNVFGIALNRASDGPNTGEINFGAPDTSRYTGDITYTPINSQGQGDWTIALDDIIMGTSSVGVKGKLAYIDTGTTYIFAPADQVAQFYSSIPGSNSGDSVTYTVPCDWTSDLKFTFSGVAYTISHSDWMSLPTKSGVCYGNIFGKDVVQGNWLVGDAFLKNVYAVFDIDQQQVGFASRAVVATSSTASAAPSPTSPGTVSSIPASTSAPPTTTVPGPSSSSNLSPPGSSPTNASSGSALSSISGFVSSTITASSGAPTLGLDGHQTSSSASAAAETTAPAPTATQTHKSGARRLGVGALLGVSILMMV